MTGLEALEYLRTHRYAGVRCKTWDDDKCLLSCCSGLDCTFWRYRNDGAFEEAMEHQQCEDMALEWISERFFDDLFSGEWEVINTDRYFTSPPVKCGRDEYYDPRYPEERFPEAE